MVKATVCEALHQGLNPGGSIGLTSNLNRLGDYLLLLNYLKIFVNYFDYLILYERMIILNVHNNPRHSLVTRLIWR
jgi:hypothetical protein